MNNSDLPLAVTNPEAARHLALSTHYLFSQDFTRALHFTRLPVAAGDPAGAINRLTTLMLTRKFEAAAEFATVALGGPVHHTTRHGVIETVTPALYFLGAREGDCSDAYQLAYELAGDANLNPGMVRWQGQALQGKSLLLSLSRGGLGGYGDHIMWARFIPHVAALGARIVVQCPPLLERLFMTLPGVVSTCGYEESPACDFATSMMELPWVLGMRGIPLKNPFNVGAVQFPEETHNVGINWGASWAAPYMDRACALAEYLPLSQLPSVTLYGLQKGSHQKQLYPPPTGMKVHDLAPNLVDFLDTAVCLMSMDAVVTTDNVVGNLACMLGRPTFVLVPKCADWRWGEGGRAPWYPSARVYQQDEIGEWGAPIARLVHDLTRYLREQGRQLPKPVTMPESPVTFVRNTQPDVEAQPEEIQA